jgi:hypothetical protein
METHVEEGWHVPPKVVSKALAKAKIYILNVADKRALNRPHSSARSTWVLSCSLLEGAWVHQLRHRCWNHRGTEGRMAR